MSAVSFFSYFTDPVLRAPTLGCVLMCLAAALVGVVVFLRKESLLGESLSHAAYPGVIVGVIIVGGFGLQDYQGEWMIVWIIAGAFASAMLGLWMIHFLENKLRVASDTALCFVLAAFFGVGITLVSWVQTPYASLYQQAQAYLYGQAATMTDFNVWTYAILSLMIIGIICALYKELQVMTFDRSYAKSLGLPVQWIDISVFALVVLAIVIGIRSVGVVLMSAMLIAPPAAARQFTNKLPTMLFLSGIFGVLSGFLGNYLSVEISFALAHHYPGLRLALPTGPMIVLVATILCLLSLLFAPERGLFVRLARIARFRYRCVCENILKSMWRQGPQFAMTSEQIALRQHVSTWYLSWILSSMIRKGWVEKLGTNYSLTVEGERRAAHIVRLHRLWELYLTEQIGLGTEKVHYDAEEMEHILTPEIEKQLTLLLNNPTNDPHDQPIPPSGGNQ